MTENADAPRIPADPVLGDIDALFGDGGSDVVGPFLARRGWELEQVRPVQALYRPEASLVVRLKARARNRAGSSRLLTLSIERRAARSEHRPPPPEFERRYDMADPVDTHDGDLVWSFPYDPALKGLTDAAWGESVRDELGLAGERPAAVHVRPLRYRPRRRAVFAYTAVHVNGERTRPRFGKVLRTVRARHARDVAEVLRRQLVPRRSGLLRRRRSEPTSLRLSLPIATLGTNGLLYEQVKGQCLTDLLYQGGSLPAPERVARLLDEIPALAGGAIDAPAQRHRDISTAAATTGALLKQVLPEIGDGVDRVLDGVARGVEADQVERRVVHGDLYEAQIYVDDEFALHLIDLDDLGVGDPAMDAANFSAHLLAYALSAPAAKDRLVAYRGLLRDAFSASLGVSSQELAWREALVMLQLATGPFRVLDTQWPRQVARRVELAERLLNQD